MHGRTTPHGLRPFLFVAGLGSIGLSAVLYTQSLAYPGLYALLPTVGAALVITANDFTIGPFKGLNFGLARWIGDRSYSIYLWHWPLIVFYQAMTPEVGWVDGVGLTALTLILSHLSYEYVEQYYRHPQKKREWIPASLTATSLASFAAFGFGAQAWFASQASLPQQGDPNYPGPYALLSHAPVPANVPLKPSLAVLKNDLPDVYELGCHQTQTAPDAISCVYGPEAPTKTIALVGDSHAATWVPTLKIIAAANNWRLLSYTKSSCAYGQLGGDPSCLPWQENVRADLLRHHPDNVFFAAMNHKGENILQPTANRMASSWSELIASGIGVVAVKDIPILRFDPGDCLSRNAADCQVARADAINEDPIALAASEVKSVKLVDMNAALCGPEFCTAATGNVVAYRDNHHLSATYASALAPYFAEKAGIAITAAKIQAAATPEIGTKVEPSTPQVKVASTVPAPTSTAAAVKTSTPAAVKTSPSTVTQVSFSESTAPSAPVKAPPSSPVTQQVGDPLKVQLNCGPSQSYPPFKRQYQGLISGKTVTLLRGEPAKDGYETWTGTIVDKSLNITGQYIEGPVNEIKSLDLRLTTSDNGKSFEGSGKRGPRDCKVFITLPGSVKQSGAPSP